MEVTTTTTIQANLVKNQVEVMRKLTEVITTTTQADVLTKQAEIIRKRTEVMIRNCRVSVDLPSASRRVTSTFTLIVSAIVVSFLLSFLMTS